MTIYDEVELHLTRYGIEIPENERELFLLDVDGILEEVRETTNNDFLVDGIAVYPYTIKKYVADVIEYYRRPEVRNNIKSRSMGTVSYTYRDGLPEHLSSVLARYRRARFHVYRPIR